MKKRILSVLLVIALLVTVGIVAAQAEGERTPADIIAAANELSFPYVDEGETPANQTGICPICNTNQTFKPIPTTTASWESGNTSHFYGYAAEIDLGTGKIYNSGGNLHIFLNGSAITTSNTGNGVTTGGTISIFGNGSLHQDAEGVKLFYPRTTNNGADFSVAIYGGTYSANGGRVVEVWNTRKADFTNFVMYGGTLEANATSEAPLFIGMGGSARVEGGTINADPTKGVAIALNKNNSNTSRTEPLTVTGTADINGLIVQSTYGDLLISGNATVDGVKSNTSEAGTVEVTGNAQVGTLEFMSANSTLTVSGGKIGTLTATKGATTLSGGEITTATITGSAVTLTGTPVVETLDVTAATTLPFTATELAEGASIGINAPIGGAAVVTGLTADDAAFFTFNGADPLGKTTVDENGKLVVIERTLDTIADM